MNSRKSLDLRQSSIYEISWRHIWIPPLIKGDDAVVVSINLGEELIKFCSWKLNPSPLKRRSDFPLVQLPIMIPVNTLKKLPELFFRLFDKLSKF